jgi:hypothetical protein
LKKVLISLPEDSPIREALTEAVSKNSAGKIMIRVAQPKSRMVR